MEDKEQVISNTETVCKKGMTRSCLLKKLRSFNVCNKMMQIFSVCCGKCHAFCSVEGRYVFRHVGRKIMNEFR